jgi:hypothetical protein
MVFWDVYHVMQKSPTFQRNILLPSSGPKSKPARILKKQVAR